MLILKAGGMPHLFDKYPKLKDILKLNPTHKDGHCVNHTRTTTDYLVTGKFHPERYTGFHDESSSAVKHRFCNKSPSSMISFLKEQPGGTVLSVHNEDHSYSILVETDEMEQKHIWIVDSTFGFVKDICSVEDLTIPIKLLPKPLGPDFETLLAQDKYMGIDLFLDSDNTGPILYTEGLLHPSFAKQPSLGEALGESANDVESEFKP